MRARVLVTVVVVALAAVIGMASGAGAEAGSPTCSDALGIAVHGQHIIGDYVTGIGHETLGWPPNGQVGDAIAGDGPVVRGGPGPGFHFANGFSPGASFCTVAALDEHNHAVDHQQAESHSAVSPQP